MRHQNATKGNAGRLLNIGDRVEVVGQGMKGEIIGFEGPMIRVRVIGIPGGATFKPEELEKVAFSNSGPGRPPDSIDNPNSGPLAQEPLKGGFTCPQCGSQLGNKVPMACPNCGRPTKGDEGWNAFRTQPGQMNNNPVLRQAQFSAVKDPVMPTNNKVRQETRPDSFTRRRKMVDVATVSDENADRLDEDHINDCASSADGLAIDG